MDSGTQLSGMAPLIYCVTEKALKARKTQLIETTFLHLKYKRMCITLHMGGRSFTRHVPPRGRGGFRPSMFFYAEYWLIVE